MRELLELQSGQVAFISGLMSGFSLSVAVHVLRSGMRRRMAQLVFLMFLLSSLLFLIALYTDVRLGIELTGRDSLPQSAMDKVAMIRFIGTGLCHDCPVPVRDCHRIAWLAGNTCGGRVQQHDRRVRTRGAVVHPASGRPVESGAVKSSGHPGGRIQTSALGVESVTRLALSWPALSWLCQTTSDTINCESTCLSYEIS